MLAGAAGPRDTTPDCVRFGFVPGAVSTSTRATAERVSALGTTIGAARLIDVKMRQVGARFGGCYLTTNTGQALRGRPVETQAFIIGDFIVVSPDSTLRFDEKMTLKEDYDFGAQHLQRYGVVCRVNRLFMCGFPPSPPT